MGNAKEKKASIKLLGNFATSKNSHVVRWVFLIVNIKDWP